MKQIKKRTLNSQRGKSGRIYYVGLALLCVITFILYYNALNGAFLNWDDRDVIINNDAIKTISIQNVINVFSGIYSGDYRPLTVLFLSFIYALTGLNTWGYHFFSLLLHLLNIVLVFLLLNGLLKNKKGSLIGSLLFAVHPMFVESVAWISAFNDVFFASFLFSALIFYMRYIKSSFKMKYYIATLLFFILAVLTKPMAIVLPALLFLFDYYYDRKLNLRIFYEKLPFVLVALIFGIIAIVGRTTDIAETSQQFSFTDKLFFPFYSLAFYFIRFLFPVHLSAFYDYPGKVNDFLPLVYYVSPLLTGIIIFLIYRSRQIKKELIFGFLFFLINLLLVVHVISFSKSIVSDRYSYVAFFGLIFILIAFYNNDVVLKNKYLQTLKKNFMIVLLPFILFYFITTYNRVGVWQNSLSLWKDVLDKNPETALAYNNLGLHYHENGQLSEAYKTLEKAIQIDSTFAKAYLNRGNIKSDLNDKEGAIDDYTKAITIKPDYADAFNNRGNVKSTTGDKKGAIEDFTKAIEIKRDYADAFNNRGNVKNDLGDKEGAINDYSHSIAIENNNYTAFFNRGIINMGLNNFETALSDFDKVITLNNTFSVAYYNKGIAKINLKMFNSACKDFHKAKSLGYDASFEIKQYCK